MTGKIRISYFSVLKSQYKHHSSEAFMITKNNNIKMKVQEMTWLWWQYSICGGWGHTRTSILDWNSLQMKVRIGIKGDLCHWLHILVYAHAVWIHLYQAMLQPILKDASPVSADWEHGESHSLRINTLSQLQVPNTAKGTDYRKDVISITVLLKIHAPVNSTTQAIIANFRRIRHPKMNLQSKSP